MMYLLRLCGTLPELRHVWRPARSGAIYKREEDGIVLIDQDKMPRLADVHHRLPAQKDSLQLEEREIREVHLSLPAY